MRTTASTIQALERLAEAAGAVVERDGKLFRVLLPSVPDELQLGGKRSSAALAHLAFVSSTRGDWESLRQATAYDPGLRRFVERGKIQFTVDVPTTGLALWEEDALLSLAVTEVPD